MPVLRAMASVTATEQAGPADAAAEAGLAYTTDDTPGIARMPGGPPWRYTDARGRAVRDRTTLDRIAALAIPPAYTDVWISPDPAGHLQATGRDARGRKQYRYHAAFREAREAGKFEHMLEFVRALPGIRTAIARDMGQKGMPLDKVVATIVYLLEHTLIRVGNDDYARDNQSFGLTTLRDRHVRIDGSELRFRFRGKSGKEWDLKLRDRRIARLVKAAQDIPGQQLFQYYDESGARRAVSSTDVNAYLKAITGTAITAKDFRTWAGTVLAAMALAEYEAVDSAAAAKKNVRRAIERVAAQLGNTPAVCRRAYVHPEIVASYLDRQLLLDVAEEIADELADADALRPEEVRVLRFLEARSAATQAGG